MKRKYQLISTSWRGRLCTLLLIFAIYPFYSLSQENQEIVQQKNDSIYLINKIEININSGSIKIPAMLNMADGLIEVVLCNSIGKMHESLLVTGSSPVELQTSLLLLGYTPKNQPHFSVEKDIKNIPDSFRIYVEYELDGKKISEPAVHFIYDKQRNERLINCYWQFNGIMETENKQIIAGDEVSMAVTYFDQFAILTMNLPSKFNDEIYFADAKKLEIAQNLFLVIRRQ
ncbi:MAG: YdjY domain-containing protein [Bacteroidales bacterium]|nr:YdjY domain-containing protein [Bacteroidales bacterium]MCF8455667.1 YdjY domain-containing protein [Bacteroidales bacterium]